MHNVNKKIPNNEQKTVPMPVIPRHYLKRSLKTFLRSFLLTLVSAVSGGIKYAKLPKIVLDKQNLPDIFHSEGKYYSIEFFLHDLSLFDEDGENRNNNANDNDADDNSNDESIDILFLSYL